MTVLVAPHVGAWIEINRIGTPCYTPGVAPHVGAWIEIDRRNGYKYQPYVAPHVGAWIEIWSPTPERRGKASHPTWVRGLKCMNEELKHFGNSRTPRGCVD